MYNQLNITLERDTVHHNPSLLRHLHVAGRHGRKIPPSDDVQEMARSTSCIPTILRISSLVTRYFLIESLNPLKPDHDPRLGLWKSQFWLKTASLVSLQHGPSPNTPASCLTCLSRPFDPRFRPANQPPRRSTSMCPVMYSLDNGAKHLRAARYVASVL